MGDSTLADWILVVLVGILVVRDFMVNRKEKKIGDEPNWEKILTGILLRMAEALESSCEGLEEIATQLAAINATLKQILAQLGPKNLVLKILAEGELMGSPVTLGAKGGVCTLQNGSGQPYVPVGAIVFASDNTAVLTVDQSGNVAVAAGAASGQSANISAMDQGNSQTDSVLCTLALVAEKLVLVVTPNP